MNTLLDVKVVAVLDRLFAESDASEGALEVAAAPHRALMTSRTKYRELYGALREFALPVSRETGELLYMLVRSSGAKQVVEFGTSFGISTIYIAAALRDNGGDGRVITTEFEAAKVARAKANLRAAGLEDLVEFREGDALETLSEGLPEMVDLLLLDGAKALYQDVLALVEPKLRAGTVVLVDDARHCAEFVRTLRESAEYVSMALLGDLEMAVRVGRS